MKPKIKKAGLAYSGGLDTSVIIPWLKENYGCEVVAVAVDVGQAEETSGLEEKAKKTGASEFRLVDAKDEFAKDYIFPVLKAGAVYEHDYLLGTATARPLIAKKQVEIALATGCDALAHGCTGKGNDQVRFELAYMALAPELAIIAPWREWDILSREDAIDYAAARGIPVPVTKKDPYSRDRNLWHLSHEGGPLEEPGFEPEASMFKLTVDPEKAPDTPERVTISFEAGLPVAVNGKRLAPVALIETLNALARPARRRPRRPRREPADRDQVARRLRDAGRHAPRAGAPGARDAHARPRQRSREGEARGALRRARLLRPVVLAAAGGARRVHERAHADRDGRGDAEAVQGRVVRRRADVSVRALLDEPRLVRHARLHPGRRRRVHPPVRPARRRAGSA